jgi:hypothetical protein
MPGGDTLDGLPARTFSSFITNDSLLRRHLLRSRLLYFSNWRRGGVRRLIYFHRFDM